MKSRLIRSPPILCFLLIKTYDRRGVDCLVFCRLRIDQVIRFSESVAIVVSVFSAWMLYSGFARSYLRLCRFVSIFCWLLHFGSGLHSTVLCVPCSLSALSVILDSLRMGVHNIICRPTKFSGSGICLFERCFRPPLSRYISHQISMLRKNRVGQSNYNSI